MKDDREKPSRTASAFSHGKINRGQLVVKTIRLYESDLKALTVHFEANERTLSQGIRKVLDDYMKTQGL